MFYPNSRLFRVFLIHPWVWFAVSIPALVAVEHKCNILRDSHTPGSGFHYETYIGISPYRTLDVVELRKYVTWSCEKIQTLFLFQHSSNE